MPRSGPSLNVGHFGTLHEGVDDKILASALVCQPVAIFIKVHLHKNCEISTQH